MMHILAHAKINLDLQILGKRADGYHEISTVMQALTLADELEIELTETPGICLRAEKTDAKNTDAIPADQTNLAYRAAEAVLGRYAEKRAKAGRKPVATGVSIRLIKQIPAAAGLAGGSSDAAAVLFALQTLLHDKEPAIAFTIEDEELYAIAKTLGADVPYCLYVNAGKVARVLCTGIGDILSPVMCDPEKPVSVLLVKPLVAISTPEIYRLYDSGNRKEAKNVLEPVAKILCPEIETIEGKLQALGHAETVQMSGSGPTVFGIYQDETACKEDAQKLRSVFPSSYAILTTNYL